MTALAQHDSGPAQPRRRGTRLKLVEERHAGLVRQKTNKSGPTEVVPARPTSSVPHVKPALLLTLLLAGCGSSTTTTSTTSTSNPPPPAAPTTTAAQATSTAARASTKPKPKPKPKPVVACIGGRVAGQPYGGIGASVSAFKNSNPTAANGPPASYQDGIAFYEIKDSVHGCVSEYTITESTTPMQSARDLLFLVGGIGLPDDAHQLLDQNTCAVWSSGSLKKATGHLYAVGFVEVAPEGDATGIVDMSAGDSPKC